MNTLKSWFWSWFGWGFAEKRFFAEGFGTVVIKTWFRDWDEASYAVKCFNSVGDSLLSLKLKNPAISWKEV